MIRVLPFPYHHRKCYVYIRSSFLLLVFLSSVFFYFTTTTTKKLLNLETEIVKIVIWPATTKLIPLDLKRDSRVERLAEVNNNRECFRGCHIEMSRDPLKVNSADAVIFDMLTSGFHKKELPLSRKGKRMNPEQIWIYKQSEPPTHYSAGEDLNDLFNWTLTFRRDSDLYLPYDKLVPVPVENYASQKSDDTLMWLPFQIPGESKRKWIQRKEKFGLAIISNCGGKSKRLEILKKLKSLGLPIDIYGKCGITKGICGREESNCLGFWREFSAKYKFYFAFENSLCTDYITEKFGNPLRWGLIPVVLGRGNYTDVAPPGSFIDLRDYPDPKMLVKYLKMLDEDEEAYGKYFEWRKSYSVVSNRYNFCQLCARLKEHKMATAMQSEAMQNEEGGSDNFIVIPPKQFKMEHKIIKKKKQKLSQWWASGMGGPVCISPEKMGLGEYLKK